MAPFFLSSKESKARLREAQNARKNREEIVKAVSQGQITRRELVKWGLITAGGLWVPVHGLSPFAKSAFGTIPDGPAAEPAEGLDLRWHLPAKASANVRYGEPIIFRHHNALPIDPQPSTAASVCIRSRRTSAMATIRPRATASPTRFFFQGQFYDYRWPMVLAGHMTINTGAPIRRPARPLNGGINNVPGDGTRS